MGVCNDGDIVRVTAKFLFHGTEDYSNVYHAQCALTGAASDASVHAAIAAKLDSQYDYVVPFQSLAFDYTTIETWNVTQDRPMVEAAWPSLTAGEATGDALPAQCAALTLFGTNTARSQGRKFLAGFMESMSDSGGEILGTLLTALAQYASGLIVPMTITEGEMQFGNWSVDLARFADWASSKIGTVWRTQRRRVLGIGD